MAFGAKTNERPGTRAQVKYSRVSAYKAREVLDLIRGKHVQEADDILAFVDRDVAIVIRKCLASAVANAQTNDQQDPETLFVSACFADEGPTLKRWRPRARGRATRIRKRTCHITIIVSRMGEQELRIWQAKQAKHAPAGSTSRRRGGAPADRRARVAKSRQAGKGDATEAKDADVDETTEVPGEPTEETIEAADEAAEIDAETTTDEAADEAAEDQATDADSVDDAAEAPAGAADETLRDGEASPEERSDEGDK